MANDSLKQVGNALNRNKKTIDHTLGYYWFKAPMVERSNDIITTLMPYSFEFYTYTDKPSVRLTIIITEGFRMMVR